jgi:LPXTG-site transpeptidase (sortase) family protein
MGIALILVALGFMIRNYVEDSQAGRRAQELLEQMLEEQSEAAIPTEKEGISTTPVAQRPNNQENSPQEDGNYTGETHAGETTEVGEPIESAGTTGTNKKPALNYSTIGIIEIPMLNLKLPVIWECSDALLNISPCRIAGSCIDKPKRLVIAGHNLKSHFGGLSSLNLGDEVSYMMKDGTEYRYTVVEIGECHRDNPEIVQEGDGWDMTLVTCKNIRTLRTLIRCREISEPAAEQTTEQATEQTAEQTVEQATEQATEQTTEETAEQTAEQTAETAEQTRDEQGVISEQ